MYTKRLKSSTTRGGKLPCRKGKVGRCVARETAETEVVASNVYAR
ncbi:hypothetical protein GGD55_003932 [Rhizobium giardinii]|uniref:Uncharacterized protein n=1 Tax=Rhizobium giardinii TaxID=56731 RepID=A0A7W8XA09_9HYPH|nr:hypothetical protein [Rhizobium giardinii]